MAAIARRSRASGAIIAVFGPILLMARSSSITRTFFVGPWGAARRSVSGHTWAPTLGLPYQRVRKARGGQSWDDLFTDESEKHDEDVVQSAMEGDTLLGFGKHATSTYEQVLKDHEDYCQYVVNHLDEDSGPAFRNFAGWLEAHGFSASKGIVNFGKHKGSTFEEVLNDDKQYCEFVVRQADQSMNPEFTSFAGWLQAQGVSATKDRVSATKDNQDPTQLDSQNPKQLRLGFGKHRDLTYAEALQQEPSYCEWVLSESGKRDAFPSFQAFADWLQQQQQPATASPAVTYRIRFGRFKGRTIEEAKAEDPDYLEWVRHTSKQPDAGANLVEFARQLEDAEVELRNA